MKTQPAKGTLFKYGLSTLHAWIRCFKCIIHIQGYDKDIVATRKTKFQNENIGGHSNGWFRKHEQWKYSQNVFQYTIVASQIIGVVVNARKRFITVSGTMACGYTVNSEAFREGAWETAGLYINTYPWCCMPPSVHKILIHGADITENVSLRIGMMSEETLKAQTIFLKSWNITHARIPD